MDYYGNKQPPRVYPFFKSQGTRTAPVTGQTVERQVAHQTTYNLAATPSAIFVIDTILPDANNVVGAFNLGLMCGNNNADEFVLDWEQVHITLSQSPIPTTAATALQFVSVTARIINGASGASPATLWQSAPFSNNVLGNPELATDFAVQMKPLRWDAYQFIDVRTMRLQNVYLAFRIVINQSQTAAANTFTANSVLRYTVQNLNATALPTPVQF